MLKAGALPIGSQCQTPRKTNPYLRRYSLGAESL